MWYDLDHDDEVDMILCKFGWFCRNRSILLFPALVVVGSTTDEQLLSPNYHYEYIVVYIQYELAVSVYKSAILRWLYNIHMALILIASNKDVSVWSLSRESQSITYMACIYYFQSVVTSYLWMQSLWLQEQYPYSTFQSSSYHKRCMYLLLP